MDAVRARNSSRASTRVLTIYSAWMAGLVLAYFLLPEQKLFLWTAIGTSSAAAVVIGVRRNRPRRRLPWYLVALALLVFTIGDTTWLILTEVLGQPNPYPSVADILYLGMYVFLVAGLLLLPRSATRRDRTGIIDALVLTAGVGLLAWIFLIRPYVVAEDLSTLQRLTSIAYPLSDILVLGVAAALVTSVRRTPSVVLMALGGFFLLATDVVYGLSQLQETWSMGGPIDFGWIVFYALWGAAALHPSMVSLTDPRIVRQAEVTRGRLTVLTLSALIAPAVLLIENSLTGGVRDGVAIAVLSAIIFLLVLIRLAGVVARHRHATERERGLREAGAALLSATDVDSVRLALDSTVDRLVRPGATHRLQLMLRGDPYYPPGATPRPTRFMSTDDLRPLPLDGFEIALVSPLILEDRPAGDPHIGTLILAANETDLESLQPVTEVLASQAALAIERITLGQEITRRNSEEYFRTLVHNTADVILIVSDDNRIRYASPSATNLFGHQDLAAQPLRGLIYPTHREAAWQLLEGVRQGTYEGEVTADWSVLGASGEVVEVEVSCRDLRQDPTVRGLVLTLRDVTEQRRLDRELKHRAFHDALTGLPNRVLFTEQVQQAVSRSRLDAAIVGVLFIDIDDFRVINDTIGHEVGDELLVAVAQRLRDVQRPGDSAARLGGDEFGVLIESARDAIDIEQQAERMVGVLAEPLNIAGNLVNPSASIGVATTIDAAGSGDLLRQADLALYVAKEAGKSRWRRYQSALHTAMVERLALRSALEQAIRDDDFVLQYQPIVSLATGETIGLEALVRWNHAERGLLGPIDFIEVAEDSGLIVPIGNWVLREATGQAVTWSSGDPARAPYISVNVSARQFRSPGFVDQVRQDLARSGLPPHRLMLEITESLLLRDDEQVWSDLSALKQLGVQVAIDDFGTGYSSLSYLRQVPIDVVKIDKSFIDTMESSPQQRALVEGIVRLAHTLGLQVVAEGIQAAGDRDALVAIGCPFGQGYLFSRPLDGDRVAGWLHQSRVPV